MTMASHLFGSPGQVAGRRQVARVRLALPAKIILITGYAPCLLDDLSQTGACISIADAAPPIGDSAVLTVQGVEAFGVVVWRHGTRFGLQFEERLASDAVIRLRAINDHFVALEAEQRRRQARNFVEGQRGVS